MHVYYLYEPATLSQHALCVKIENVNARASIRLVRNSCSMVSLTTHLFSTASSLNANQSLLLNDRFNGTFPISH